jgi:hypothetical protein
MPVVRGAAGGRLLDLLAEDIRDGDADQVQQDHRHANADRVTVSDVGVTTAAMMNDSTEVVLPIDLAATVNVCVPKIRLNPASATSTNATTSALSIPTAPTILTTCTRGNDTPTLGRFLSVDRAIDLRWR